MRRLTPVVLALALAAAACGGGEEGAASKKQTAASFLRPDYSGAVVYPQVISSDLAVGENRVLVGLLDQNDAPIGSPDIAVTGDFYDLAQSSTEPAFTEDLRFLWSIKPQVGYYATELDFDAAGDWGIELTVTGGGLEETVKGSFSVAKEPVTPAVGERPPASDTPTAEDVKNLAAISTDENPDPSYYKLSVKEALARREPFVVIFATPKFCLSQICGPTLDVVQRVAKDFPNLTMIHVEPYELPADPSNLRPVKFMEEWGLPSEPWTFVVGADGKVVARFEGPLDAGSLERELQAL